MGHHWYLFLLLLLFIEGGIITVRLVMNVETVGLGSGGESEGFLIFSVLRGWGGVG